MYYKTISKKNAQFQVFLSYRQNRTKRARDAKIFVEGVVPINAAVATGLDVDAVLVEENRDLSGWARDTIRKLKPNDVYQVSTPLMAELSGKENTSELLVIANRPKYTLTDAELATYRRILILDRPSSPGNLGTILRSCDAFAVDAVLMIGHAVDQYDPKTITASRGVVFRMPVITGYTNTTLIDLVDRMKDAHQFRFYGTSAKGTSQLDTLEFAPKSCFVIGNETMGMSQFSQTLVDEMVVIPMLGFATSLNIACATSIVLYQLNMNQPQAA